MRFIIGFALFLCFGVAMASGADTSLENRIRNNYSSIERIAGDKFAGTWISSDGGKQVLALTSPIDMSSSVFDGVEVLYVKYNYRQLLLTQQTSLRSLLVNNADIYGTALDLEKNKIAIRAKSENFDKLAKLLVSKNIDMSMIYFENQNEHLNLFSPVDPLRK